MRNYIITTDDTTDLPSTYIEENKLECLHLSYVIRGDVYDGISNKLSIKEFYDAIREGAMPFTQQVNPEQSKDLFEKVVSQGYDIIHIAFSSGLSGTYNSARIGAEEVMEMYPDARIVVIDSLCASLGEGLLVYEAIKRKKAGMGYDELAQWVEHNKLRMVHEVMADDLYHLQRGGRVSKTAAVLGTTLGVKPILHIDEDGRLIPFSKQRHRGGAMKYLVNNLLSKINQSDNLDTVAISHSDSENEANKLAELVREKAGIQNIIISDIGPTIGSHTGIGTIGLFYFSDNRSVK